MPDIVKMPDTTIPSALRDYVQWVNEANSDNVPQYRKIGIGDIDAELLEKAADIIEALYFECKRWRQTHDQS